MNRPATRPSSTWGKFATSQWNRAHAGEIAIARSDSRTTNRVQEPWMAYESQAPAELTGLARRRWCQQRLAEAN
jgi:hypothetical protein